MNALVLQDVTKRYAGHQALRGVSLALPPGRCLALIGHNGAGKTTMMKLMLGLIRPSSGTVSVLGDDPAAAGTAFRRRIGFLPENVAFHDELSGRDTLRFYARLKGVDDRQGEALLDRVGLLFAADRRVKTYSKGMRQRLGLAQALLGHPSLLLLDEPTTGLDPVLRQEVYAIIAELAADGVTIVLSSHVLTELDGRSDQVAIIRQGDLVGWGSLGDLREQAGLPVRVRLVSPTPEQLPDRLGALADRLHIGSGHHPELWCTLQEKMDVIRLLGSLTNVVSDMEVILPGLDDVYAHFSKPAAAGTSVGGR